MYIYMYVYMYIYIYLCVLIHHKVNMPITPTMRAYFRKANKPSQCDEDGSHHHPQYTMVLQRRVIATWLRKQRRVAELKDSCE